MEKRTINLLVIFILLIISIVLIYGFINKSKENKLERVDINKTNQKSERNKDTSAEFISKNVVEIESYKKDKKLLYKYTLFDNQGNPSYQEEDLYKEPTIKEISDGLIKITRGAGTGIILTRYYDQKNDRISDIYITPFDEYENKIITFETNKMVIQDIFDKNEYYKEININTSETADPTSAIIDAKFIDDNNIEVTYMKGNDYIKVTEIIKY